MNLSVAAKRSAVLAIVMSTSMLPFDSLIACPALGPLSSRPEWVQARQGCRLFVPMPPATMPNIQRGVRWDGNCVSGLAEGPGRVTYLWNNFVVLTVDLNSQTGAVMRAGKPAGILAPGSAHASGTCEKYVAAHWSERTILADVPDDIDLSNHLVAVAIAAQMQERAAQKCPRPKEPNLLVQVQLRQGGSLRVCASNPVEYLTDISDDSYFAGSARMRNDLTTQRWKSGVRQYALHQLGSGSGTQREFCAKFSKHRAAVLGLVARLKNERNPLRAQQIEAQIKDAYRTASQELVNSYGTGLKTFDSYEATVDKLVDRGFGRIGMSATLGCPGAPIAIDALFSNEKIVDPPNPNELGLLSSLAQSRAVLSKLNQGDQIKIDGIFRRFVIGARYDLASVSLTTHPIVLRVRVTQLKKM